MLSTPLPSTTLRRRSSLNLVTLALAGVGLAGCGAPPSNDARADSALGAWQSELMVAAGVVSTTAVATSRPIGTGPISSPPPPPPPTIVGTLPAPPPPDYTFTTLPFLPGGINDNGVIGGAWNGNIVTWSNGALTAILPLPADLSSAVAAGGALNNAGSVIGQANDRAFVWIRPLPADCTTTDCMLPTEIRAPNHAHARPNAINDANVVVGSFLAPPVVPFWDSALHAFRWSPTEGLVDITPQNWFSAVAMDINDFGEIVGYGLQGPDSAEVALRWSPIVGRPPVARLGPGEADAIAITGVAAGVGSGSAPTFWSVPTTAAPNAHASLMGGPVPSDVDAMADTGRVVGIGFLGTDHPNKPWTIHGGALEWLPVPADNANTISDVFSNVRVNTCGSIVASQALEFKAANATVFDSNGFLWTKPACDPPPPAFYYFPPGSVAVTTATGIQ